MVDQECILCGGLRIGKNTLNRVWRTSVLQLLPKQHKKRRNQTEAYHRRIQKKWDKRKLTERSEPKVLSYPAGLYEELQRKITQAPFPVVSFETPRSLRESSFQLDPLQFESRLHRINKVPKVTILKVRPSDLKAKISNFKLDRTTLFRKFLEDNDPFPPKPYVDDN